MTHDGSANAWVSARSLNSFSGGKIYYEVEIGTMNSYNYVIGLADSSHALNTFIGGDASNVGIGWMTNGSIRYDGTSVSIGTAASTGDIIQIAADLDTGDFWVGKNGTWLEIDSSDDPDPATGTDPGYTESELIGIDVYIAATFYDKDNHDLTLRTHTDDFDYSVPSGFSAPEDWDSGA